MSETDRSRYRRIAGDFRCARDAMRRHGPYASGRLAVQADSARGRAAESRADGRHVAADHFDRRADRLDRVRVLIAAGKIAARTSEPSPSRPQLPRDLRGDAS